MPAWRMGHPSLVFWGGLDEAPMLVVNQSSCPAARELGTLAPDPLDGVSQGLHAPGGACDREGVAEQGEVETDGVGAQAFRLPSPDERRDVRALSGCQRAAGGGGPDDHAGGLSRAIVLAAFGWGVISRR